VQGGKGGEATRKILRASAKSAVYTHPARSAAGGQGPPQG